MKATEKRLEGAQIKLASVMVPVFWAGCGFGVVTLPFQAGALSGFGPVWDVVWLVSSIPLSGVASCVAIILGFPAYLLYCRVQKGHRVRVEHNEKSQEPAT